jgi:hypothetical protein
MHQGVYLIGVDGPLISRFDLSEYLLVPHDHRLQPGRDLEDVAHGRLVASTKGNLFGPGPARRPSEGGLHAVDVGLNPVEIGLGSIARGQKDEFRLLTQNQVLVYRPLTLLVEGKGLGPLHRGVLVIKSQRVKSHEERIAVSLLYVARKLYNDADALFVALR